nr:cytochrome O ubiquinol oxidase subunit I [Raoultella sp. NCTC 9187]
MGAGANVNAFFGITTMIIAIPTGVKIFNWLFTMYQGRIVLNSAMLWTIGFIVTFSVGGMTGVLLAVPGADFVLHQQPVPDCPTSITLLSVVWSSAASQV